MEFDLLVRKYLRGAMDEGELERFRDLLERIPAYRTELREILELRSLMHDDSLRLNPPKGLSEETRSRVGRKFADIEALILSDATALVPPTELSDSTRLAVASLFAPAAPAIAEEPRRRAVILPYRIVSRFAMAASVAIAIAVTPALIHDLRIPTDGAKAAVASISPSGSVSSAASQSGVEGASDAAGRSVLASAATTSGTGASLVSAPSINSVTGAGSTVSRGVVGVSSARAAGADRALAAREHLASGAGLAANGTERAKPTGSHDSSVAMPSSLQPSSSLAMLAVANDYHPAADSVWRRPEPIAGLVASESGNSDPRRLSIGVALGSGSSSSDGSPLMQSSYYFAYSVTNSDRIGVEMGGSVFAQNATASQGGGFAKRSRGLAKGNAGGDPGSPMPSTPTAPAVVNTPGPQSSVPAQVITTSPDQQMTYGGLFYDRKITLSHAWDLCGRLTVGATDGAVITSARAYAAFNPSRSVTLTIGVGGSKLNSLGNPNGQNTVNYGIFYGIESGF